MVGFSNPAFEKAPSFSAHLDESRRGFRADISAALEPHWFGSDRVSPPPRRALEHFDHHFEHSRQNFSFHTHQIHTIVTSEIDVEGGTKSRGNSL
jgi:hypothetical protein